MRVRGLFTTSMALGALASMLLLAAPAVGQQYIADGSLLRRSDGALYLVSNGERHAIQPAALGDDQITAVPEGEPFTSPLAPVGMQLPAQYSRDFGAFSL